MLVSLFNKLLYRKLYKHPLVKVFMELYCVPSSLIGWGYRHSGNKVKRGTEFILLEDGFIRSMFPGYKNGRPYSLVVDKSGMYFDASGDSDLILYLNGSTVQGEQWIKKISQEEISIALNRVRKTGVSKYNCYLDQKRQFEEGILVVDQTSGDVAIEFSGMSLADFDSMLEDAINENPNKVIYVKTHPDHKYRAKHSCFSQELFNNKRVVVLPHDVPVAEALSFCHTVYVGSSLLGMEALIHKKTVVCYGASFYSGWGLTVDRAKVSNIKRTRELSLDQLFEAAYLRYTHYFDPDTLKPCSIHRVIDHIELQWLQWRRFNDSYVTYGLSPWKKQLLPFYLGPKVNSIQHSINSRCETGIVVTWGARVIPRALQELGLIRIEDGFIRSRGLGANFNLPLSWVLDEVGIYFDARSESALENILQYCEFTSSELEQSAELIHFLKQNKLTKYNLGIEEAKLPDASCGKKLILIPGQVDSDASITYGSPKIKNNRELIEEVRQQHPEAYICYKPHPDLLSSARKGVPLWEGIEREVDYIVTQGDIISWIQAVDEVHTLTSTVGFEALLHDRKVFTYGLPFYAGWGLTEDWLICERRSRKRSLAELAYGVLIKYPTYLNPVTKEYTTSLQVAKFLADPECVFDSRSGMLKIIGQAKCLLNKITKMKGS